MLAVSVVGCQKDNIVAIDPIETDDSEDLIANTVFTQTVSVAFSTDGNAIVTGTNDDFTISINGKATGSMLVPHLAGYIPQDEETLTPSFWDLGIRLAYDVHLYKHYCLEISCGVKNILDQYQRDIDKGEFRDASYIYGPSMPRTYFAGLILKI